MAISVRDIDRGWARIRRELALMRGSYTKVGVQVGTRRDGEATEMAVSAAANEFGVPAKNIPARSFLRSTHDEEVPRVRRALANEKDKIFTGRSTVKRSLGLVGEYMTGRIKRKILSNIPPPNSPATIRKKTRAGKVGNRTLVDTGQMLNSIRHVEVLAGRGGGAGIVAPSAPAAGGGAP